jgi:hypothetical protein
MRIKLLITLGVAIFSTLCFSADLFQDGKLREIKNGDPIVATDTVGGYPIFQDDGRWKFTSGRRYDSTGGADPIRMGTVLLDYYQGTRLLARQSLSTSLDSGGVNRSWSGDPCSFDHFFIRNKSKGKQDQCMTIDPKIVNLGNTPTLFLTIVLTNSGSNGRYYQMWLYVNADLLGIKNTGLGDWTKELLKTKPHLQTAFDRLSKWGELLQDASMKTLDYSKPLDIYKDIPSLMTLLPVPEDLSSQKRSVGFLMELENLRYQAAYSSIAYSPWEDYKGSWGYASDKPSQELADSLAIEYCENDRKKNRPNAPTCTIYRINDWKSVSKAPSAVPSPSAGIPEKLEKLKNLYSNGLITKEQYDAQVKDLLEKM